MRSALLATTAIFTALPAYAGEWVMSLEGGMAFYGDSGVGTVDKLERDEIATGNVKAAGVWYQVPAPSSKGPDIMRIGLLYEHADADGDWGVHQPNGDLARQTVQIASSSLAIGLEYDLKRIAIGDLYPFAGVGARVNINRPEGTTVIELAGGGQRACLSDNGDTFSLGWHALGGLGYDIGPVTVRTFYQYTDRGRAFQRGDNCPQRYEPYTVNLKDHSVRLRVSFKF